MPCWWSKADLLALTLLAAAAPAAAQAPSDRAALAALQDSLDAAATPAHLAAISRNWAGKAPPAMSRLRRGFHALAAARLSGERGDFDRALIEFDWAITAARHWPYPWFGRGLAKLALSEGGFRTRPLGGQPYGRNFYVGFTEDLVRAFEREHDFGRGVELLLDLLPPQGDRSQPTAFVRALELAAAKNRRIDPAAHLVLGRAYRTAGQDERALDAFERFAAAGGDPSTAALERARSFAGLGRLEEAAAAYMRGAELDTRETRHVYRRDLAWVATDSELVVFDSVPPATLGAWISGFWAIRDAEAVRRPGERLREHLRRWSYAFRRFRVESPERKTDYQRVIKPDIGPCVEGGESSIDNLTFEDPGRLDDARRRERLLDHRGVVYIRHGEPAARIRAVGSGAERGEVVAGATAPLQIAHLDPAQPFVFPGATESLSSDWDPQEVWQYWFEGASRLLYFSGSLALGRRAPSTQFAYIPLQPALLHRVAALDSRYRKVATAVELERAGMRRAGPVDCMSERMLLRRENRQAMIASVKSDSYTLLFPAPLDPILQAMAVGQPSVGTGRLLVVFAVPGDRLRPVRFAGGVRYRLGIRISAVDHDRKLIVTADTFRTFIARDTIRAGSYLSGLLEAPAPAGAYAVRAAIHELDDQAGSAASLGTVALGAGAGALGMSDLVLGSETGGLRWDNRGDPVLLNALNAYRTGDAAPVYYEAFGLVPGRAYRTTLSVRKASGSDTRSVSLVFDEKADRPVMAIRRTIGLDELEPGQYLLELTIDDEATGARVTRSRLINVAKR